MASIAPANDNILTAAELHDLLVKVIAGVRGETEGKWSKNVGPVKKLPTWRYVHCNWRVNATGTAAQRMLVEQCIDIVRRDHPYVIDGVCGE